MSWRISVPVAGLAEGAVSGNGVGPADGAGRPPATAKVVVPVPCRNITCPVPAPACAPPVPPVVPPVTV